MDACHARVFVSNESTMTDESSKPTLHNLLKGTAAEASDLNRRRFVRQMAWSAGAMTVLPLAACGGDDGQPAASQPIPKSASPMAWPAATRCPTA
jgi:alkaline phosphatase D